MTEQGRHPDTQAPPRQRLLDAAEELFYSRGVVNTGVDAILRRAQVARKTLYHQFGGKDGLVVEYLRLRDLRWSAHWQETIDAHASPDRRLLAIFDALATWEGTRQRRGCAFIDALVEVADPSHPASAVVRDHWTAIADRLRLLAADTGTSDPDGLAADIGLIYRGALTAMLLEPRSTSVARAHALGRARVELATRTDASGGSGGGR